VFYTQKNALTGWEMEKIRVLHAEKRFDRLGNGKNECFIHRRTL